MSKLDPNAYGGSEDKLTPDDIDGDTVILVVTEATEVDFDPGMGLKIYGEDNPDHPFIVSSKKDVRILIAKLGDDPEKWVGEQIPIESAIRTYKGKEFNKLVVVPEADWDEVLGIPKQRTPAQKKKAAKVKKRAGGRR